MTDSLTPGDLQRMEAWVSSDMKSKDKESLIKSIDKNRYFPSSLKNFLKKEMGKKLPSERGRKAAEKKAQEKGIDLGKFKVTEFKWRPSKEMKAAMDSVAIRDSKGRFKTWFRLPQ